MRKIADFITEFSPASLLGGFSTSFFFFSVAGAFGLGPLMTWAISHFNLETWFIDKSDLLSGISELLDPWLVQLLFGCVLSFMIVKLHGERSKLQKWVWPLWPFLLLVLSWVIVNILFKPGFGYNSARLLHLDALPEPWLTGRFQAFILMVGFRSAETVPSGFVTRQIVLAFLFALIVRRMTTKSQYFRVTLNALNIFLVLVVFLIRFYRRDLTLVDVALTIPMAIMVFWLIMTPMFRLFDDMKDLGGQSTHKALWNTVAAYIVTNFILFSYALRPEVALQQIIMVIVFFGAFYSLVELIQSVKKKSADYGR